MQMTQAIKKQGFDPLSVPQYAIAFDMDTKRMDADAVDKRSVYREAESTLKACGFTSHPQGSLYHTQGEKDNVRVLIDLKSRLLESAPNFCKYVRSIFVFRMEEWSDVTPLIAGHKAQPPPSIEELF